MANNFATLKNSFASEKFNLIRIEPARAIEGDLTLSSGTTYTCTFAFQALSKILVNGNEYDLVAGVPASGEYSFSESTTLITINLGAALTSQIVVAYYFIYFSKDKTRITYSDPLDSATTNRQWAPRIAENPSFSFNLKDITEGYLSYGISSIELFNEDGFFEQYLTDNDSFASARITIWLALNNVSNVKLVFRGVINKITLSRRVSIEYFDEFSILNKTFFSNGNFLNSSYNSTRFAMLHPSRENTPIYRLFAEVSKYTAIDDGLATGLHKMKFDDLMPASCITFSTVISTSTNREWGAVLGEGDGGEQNDVIVSLDNTDPDFTVIGYTPGKKYRIGDTLKINLAFYARVYYVDDAMSIMKTTKNPGIFIGDPIVRPGVSLLVKQNNIVYYPFFGRDFSVAYAGQINDIVKITFVNNFEAFISLPAPLNPDTDEVRFRAWADTGKDLLHGSVVQTILEDAGLEVNAASIAAANATPLYANFYVPNIDEGSFKPYAANIESLLFSTVGYLSLNDGLEFEYALFNAPGSTSGATDREILLDSFSTVVDYNDIRDTVVPENPHNPIELGYTNPSATSNRARYLHRAEKQVAYKHVLADQGRMSQFAAISAERKARYKFVTKVNPDVMIGDDFILERSKLIGNNSSRNITIVGIQKRATEAALEGFDFLGL